VTDFPVENLPYGIVGADRHVGVALGDRVFDVTEAARAGMLTHPDLLTGPTLNPFLAAGRPAWTEVRSQLTALLHDPASLDSNLFSPISDTLLHLPIDVGDYVDFYSSIEHATNLGRLFRPDSDPLLPNWRHLPVGYHGRSGTIVVSGTPIRRPQGQRLPPGATVPEFGPSVRLDIELELGFVVGGPTNALGRSLTAAEAAERVFGVVLVNDWSARDIQAWEYQPLGPFLGKSFATTISAWVVPFDALTPHRVTAPRQDPEPLPHLRVEGDWGLDVELAVERNGEVVSRTNARHLYWTIPQQLAHATSNGATIRPGDLFATGTISGPDPGSYGSFIELTEGKGPFLADGDTIVLRGWAERPGLPRIGLGECAGTVVPT
jgi:fumarylacetoacetase